MAKDVLGCDRSPSGGRNELGWFSLGITYACVHFTMSIVNKDDEDGDDYVAGIAVALAQDKEGIAMRMLDYAERHGEMLDCMTVEELKRYFTAFRKEFMKHLNKDDEI